MFDINLRLTQFSVLVVLVLCCVSHSAAEEVVTEFTGSSSRTTAEFEVEAPWILDWRVTGQGAAEVAVDVSLEEAGTTLHQGRVLETRSPGNGVRLFRQSGRFYFRVYSSFANWTLKVVELTDEEAALYTPISDAPLDR